MGEDAGAATCPYPDEELVIEPAEPDDIPAVLAVEQAAWPETEQAMQATTDKFSNRQEADGLLVATYHGDAFPAHDGAVVGSISFQQPDWLGADTIDDLLADHDQYGDTDWDTVVDTYGFAEDWYVATDDGYVTGTHDPEGDVGFLIGVGIHPALQGNGYAGHLLTAALATCEATGNDYVTGYARVPGFHDTDVDIDTYVNPDTKPTDPVVGFHADNGATVVCHIPDAMPDDAESKGYGALVVYDLDALDPRADMPGTGKDGAYHVPL